MKIQKIEIANVLGLARADITLDTPVLLVAGDNEAGKSSISDAISMAILGQPRRVKLKKDLSQLLHDSAAKGRITVLANDDVLGEFKLPKGEHQVADMRGAEFVPYVLDSSLFARADEATRRSLLFKLTNCKASPERRAEMMLARGCKEELVEQIKPLLRGSFESACTDAKERATQAKGAFKALTGENWGAKQSAEWRMEIPEGDPVTDEQIAKAAADVQATQEQVEKGTLFLGGLQQKRQAFESAAGKREQLEALAKTITRATAKRDTTQKDLDTWVNKHDELKAELAEAQGGSTSVACPCCAEKLQIVGSTLIKFDGKESDPKRVRLLSEELNKAVDAVTLLSSTLQKDNAAIKAADDANNELGILQSQVENVSDADLEKTNTALAGQKLKLAERQARLEALSERKNLLASAERINAEAAMHHSNVLAWLDIAAALAPDGIPAEILESALSPVNDVLAMLAGIAGWKKVVITRDMDITVNGRVYGLISESAKWRADTLIALAIAQISELRLIVLDRFDVLDLPGRGQLLALLCELAKVGSMDTMIMCGTLKALPATLPPAVAGIWIKNGIAETEN